VITSTTTTIGGEEEEKQLRDGLQMGYTLYWRQLKTNDDSLGLEEGRRRSRVTEWQREQGPWQQRKRAREGERHLHGDRE
jgi:hypothetical protein